MVQRPQKWTRRKVSLNQLEQMKHSIRFRGYFSLFDILSLNLRGEMIPWICWKITFEHLFKIENVDLSQLDEMKISSKNDQKSDKILYFSCFWYTLPVCESSGCYVFDTLCGHLRAQYGIYCHICNSVTKVLGHSLTHCV